MRSALFFVGFHAFCLGLGWWLHPGAGLTAWGLGVCVPLAWLRITGRDEE